MHRHVTFSEDDQGYAIKTTVGNTEPRVYRCDKGDDYESPTFWYPDGGSYDDLDWSVRQDLADFARFASRLASRL